MGDLIPSGKINHSGDRKAENGLEFPDGCCCSGAVDPIRRDVGNCRIDAFSDTHLYQFLAGILYHMKGMTILTNPLVNSYKRLMPGYDAPVYIAWSANSNRSRCV